MTICTCVRERSLWVCGKWVRVTKSAGVGGGWALSQRPPACPVQGRYVWAGRESSSGNFACEYLKETVHAFFKSLRTLGVKAEAEPRCSGALTKMVGLKV